MLAPLASFTSRVLKVAYKPATACRGLVFSATVTAALFSSEKVKLLGTVSVVLA